MSSRLVREPRDRPNAAPLAKGGCRECDQVASASMNQKARRALFAGDAVMRALTAAAMMPATDATAPLLAEAMQDRYPIVRYFRGQRPRRSIPQSLPKPDYLAPAETRDATLRQSARLHAGGIARMPANAQLTTERQGRAETDVEVGE